MDFAIVDMQGFKDDLNSFIVKEFSVLTKNIKFHEIIKSNLDYDELNASTKRSAEWLKEFHHGLSWDDGYISIGELRQTLQPILQNKIIYVKGRDKVQWLREIMHTTNNLLIKNLEDLGCDLNLNLFGNQGKNEPPMTCSKHKKMTMDYVCAMRNAIKLKLWYSSFCKRSKENKLK